VPLPQTLSATGEHHKIIEEAGWRIMTPRHAPHASLGGHLTFALKYEGLDLAVLKRLFEALVRAFTWFRGTVLGKTKQKIFPY